MRKPALTTAVAVLLIFGAGVLLFGAGAAQSAAPVKLRVGWVVVPNELPAIFTRPGAARHEGASYVLDAIHFSGTPPMITALATGEVDLAPLAYSSLATAIENAGMTDLRILSDEFQDGVPGYYTSEFAVRKDSPIKTVEDLKGKVVASNGIGSAVDIAMRVMLRKHHLEDKRDYTVIETGFPNMKAMLTERKVDLIPLVPPFAYDPALRLAGRTLFTQKEAIGRSQMIMFTARAGFLARNRGAVVDFMEDYLRVVRWYQDPANHRAAVDIIAQVTKQPPARFSFAFTKADYYRNPQGLPDLGALQRTIDLQRELGFLKAPLDVTKFADLSIVTEAAHRLK